MKIKQAKATPVRDGQAQKIEPKAKRPGGPGGQKFYVHDHLYSPVAVTNYLGQTAERYEYDAYGKCYILEPNFAPDPDGKSDVGNPYYFTGREMDQLNNYTLNIMNYRHRYYDTYTGRLTTHDPLGIVPNEDSELTKFEPRDQYRDNRSLYEAFGSNPVVNTDSWGLFTFPIGPPIGSHKTERLTKEAMYQFARTFLITKKH
ncbi:MAG: hypothetical protein NTX52_14725, partial [Planctomycetota bacterium]|nr:hypothetical protein [Planctomycetota bacterium]